MELVSLFPPELGASPSGCFATWGAGEDVDHAFDAAMDHALHEWGDNAVPPLDPAGLHLWDPDVPLTLAQAHREAHRRVAEHAAGVAVRFHLPRSFRRKPVRVTVTDLAVTLPPAGALATWTTELDRLLLDRARTVLEPQGLWPATVDTVELVRRQVRSRAVAQRVQGRSFKRFAVIEHDRIVAVFDTQREARAHAVALARSDGRDEAHWQLAALVGRATDDGWSPMVHVDRVPRTQKGVFRVMTVQPRENPGRPGGWVFACSTEDSSTESGTAPLPEVPAASATDS